MIAFGKMEGNDYTSRYGFTKEIKADVESWTAASSANLAIDSSCSITAVDPVEEEDSLWKEQIQKKCEKLARKLVERFHSLEYRKGLTLKFSDDLPRKISDKIADVASSEPCGLRGCCVHLRLLHEDLANALTKVSDENHGVCETRAQKCVSWHDMPQQQAQKDSYCTFDLNFRTLPIMDDALTGRISLSNSSNPQEPGLHRRLRKSLSSPAELPSLSSASKLRVPCTDLGFLDICDQFTVPTFEVYVYLVPTVTWMWRVKKLFSANIKPDSQLFSKSTISVEQGFTLVKKRLYRTRNSAFQVYRYPVVS